MGDDDAKGTGPMPEDGADTPEHTASAAEKKLGQMNKPLKDTLSLYKTEIDDMLSKLEGILPHAGIVGQQPLRDVWIVRFLVASHWKVDEAADKFRQMVAFRERYKMDEVRAKFEDGTMTMEDIPGFKEHFKCCPDTFRLVSGDAKDGSPIVVSRVTKWDFDEYYKLDQDMEDQFQYHQMEYMMWRIDKLCVESEMLRGNVKIIDLDGVTLSMRGVMKQNAAKRKERYERLGANLEVMYPEMVSKINIVNAPSFVAILWWAAKSFLQQRTIDKTVIVRQQGTKEALLNLIDAKVLPEDLGGEFKGNYAMGDASG
mmetsp:Transcript_34/g.84  ORF Transcript_34/g.84 Transcript_34/m.84 type:complete len:314 (+) Transcript_34:47-988(+)